MTTDYEQLHMLFPLVPFDPALPQRNSGGLSLPLTTALHMHFRGASPFAIALGTRSLAWRTIRVIYICIFRTETKQYRS